MSKPIIPQAAISLRIWFWVSCQLEASINLDLIMTIDPPEEVKKKGAAEAAPKFRRRSLGD
jgi:DNA primase